MRANHKYGARYESRSYQAIVYKEICFAGLEKKNCRKDNTREGDAYMQKN